MPGHDTRAMFSRIAGRYDRVNTVLSLGLDEGWRRRSVRRALTRPGLDVIDLCAGTGKVAFASSTAPHRPRLLVAADFAEPMLEAGRRSASRYGLAVAFVGCDCQRLPFRSASFDVATCAFGVRNLVNLEAGLREAARCLRPGGLLVIMEFMNPGRRWMRRLVSWYVKKAIPLVGGVLSGSWSAYRYLPDSIDSFLTPEELVQALLACGFESVEVEERTLGVCSVFYATRGREGWKTP